MQMGGGDNRSRPPGRSNSNDLIGQTIGERYYVHRRLGGGGMGSVYLAEHTSIKKKVALKVIRSELAQSEQMFKRFRQEAKAASKIGNEHIISVSDFGQLPDGTPYFVMEYLEGGDLRNDLHYKGPFKWKRAFSVVEQICEALGAAHQVGIIHRDVKPDNFYRIERHGNPDFIKVLDFGVAKLLDGDGSVVTSTGIFVGTAEYMSPEQADGKELDIRVDVYGTGILLYELITGSVPFRGKTEFEVLEGHCVLPVPSMRQKIPEVPAYAEAVVLKALEKNRDDRYQTMADLGAALAQARARGERGEDDADDAPSAGDSVARDASRTSLGGSAQGKTSTTLLYILAALVIVAIVVVAFALR